MTEIKLIRLTLKHFKGFENFTFEPNSLNAVVSGQNGSGKTTLADGLLWLLFGKDTRGAKLNPKPLDQNNEEKLGLEPTVEAVLMINGQTVTLKRVQEEKWTKPRGQLEEVRGSDTTKYTIDGVPRMEKDWKEYLEKIGPENILQMLLDSTFFMKINWKNRREILVNMTGLTDDQLIASDPELKELSSLLQEHSIDDYRKILAAQKKEIKRKIEGIPARIQEVTDMLAKAKSEIGEFAVEELQEQVFEYEADISELQSKLNTISAGNAALDYQEELSNLKVKLANAQSAHLSSANMETRSFQDDLNKQQRIVNEIRSLKYEQNSKQKNIITQIEELQSFLEDHRAKFKAIKASSFDEHQKVCPMCSQELPADEIATLIANFNQKKAAEMETNVSEGKAAKAKLDALLSDKVANDSEISRLESNLKASEQQLDKINSELNFLQTRTEKFEDTKEYKKIQDQIKIVQQKILDATSDSSLAEQELKNKIQEKRGLISNIQTKVQRISSLSTYDDRITELKKDDADLKKQNQETERQLFLLDEFTRKKVSYLEESINSKFDLVKFKLFNILKNGGLEEVCEATFNGIEYGTSLNTGARINCDLDIVNTLSKEFGLSVPVFVDNTESVNDLHTIDSQMIELRVTTDKQLKVEV